MAQQHAAASRHKDFIRNSKVKGMGADDRGSEDVPIDHGSGPDTDASNPAKKGVRGIRGENIVKNDQVLPFP